MKLEEKPKSNKKLEDKQMLASNKVLELPSPLL